MNMKPYEKAKQIVDKYLLEIKGADRYNYNLDSMNLFIAKQCGIICVDEILDYVETNEDMDYWQQVKEEIEKM